MLCFLMGTFKAKCTTSSLFTQNIEVGNFWEMCVVFFRTQPTWQTHTLPHFLQSFVTRCSKCTMRDKGRTVAWWENGKWAIIGLTGHHSPLIRSGSWVCVSQGQITCMWGVSCKLSGPLMAVRFLGRSGRWSPASLWLSNVPFRVCASCRLSMSQLDIDEGKYLAPHRKHVFPLPSSRTIIPSFVCSVCRLLRIAVIITLPCIQLRTSLSWTNRPTVDNKKCFSFI